MKRRMIAHLNVKAVALTMTALVVGVVVLGMGADLRSYALGAEGTACACGRPDIKFIKAFTNDDGVVNSSHRDPDDDGTDPGYDKDVARCDAEVVDSNTVEITIENGYPSYTCHFWTKVRNVGDFKLRRKTPVISAPSELTVRSIGSAGCCVLYPGKCAYEGFSVHIEQPSEQGVSYPFTIDLKFILDS
jgi:hypothetical protein